MRALAVLAGALALQCDRRATPLPPPTAVPGEPAAVPSKSPSIAKTGVRCALDSKYPGMWSLAEASAAVELEPRPGARAIVAFSDSDNHGDAMMWTLPAGPMKPLRLSLDKAAGDDVEGAAWAGGHLYTLTSSGAVRRYSPSAEGDLTRDRNAYPLGAPPYSCPDLQDGNCGKNYEGLCLRGTARPARCAGFAASKAEGALYCVVFHGDALAIDPIKPPIVLPLHRHALSDCAFGSVGGPAEDVLVVTTNIHGGSSTYVVDEANGALSTVDVSSLPSNEAIVVDHDGALYQFMDGDVSVSPTFRANCFGWPSHAAPVP